MLASARAGAADAPAPLTRPSRDVDITYKVPVAGGGDMAILQRLRFSASLHRQRVDLPTSGNWMMLDFSANRMFLVRDESHEVVETTPPETATLPNGGNGFARLGPSTVAGLPCTEWRTHDTGGNETITCYTDDGVLLRARSGDYVMMQAIHVAYTPQDPATFTPPPGYTRQTR